MLHDADGAFATLLTLGMQDGATSAPAGPGWGPSGTATEQQPAGPAGGAATSRGMDMVFVFMVPLLLLMILSSVFGGRKERKRRQMLLENLKKNDRVQTIGGIIGSVAEVRKDDVVLRVDESSNVRIRFAKSAITGVVSEAPGADRAIEEKPKATETAAT